MLSFKKGAPFLSIIGGAFGGRELRIHDGIDDEEEEFVYDKKKLKKYDPDHLEQLKTALDNDDPKWLMEL